MAEDDPRIAKVAAGIRQEWDLAPTVRPPSMPVRLIAFARPVAQQAGAQTTSVILTPYFWDGIEAPVPPANQMVLAKLNRPWPSDQQRFPLWVTGKLELHPSATRIGRVAYRVKDAAWASYPYQKHPLPQYQWPH